MRNTILGCSLVLLQRIFKILLLLKSKWSQHGSMWQDHHSSRHVWFVVQSLHCLSWPPPRSLNKMSTEFLLLSHSQTRQTHQSFPEHYKFFSMVPSSVLRPKWVVISLSCFQIFIIISIALVTFDFVWHDFRFMNFIDLLAFLFFMATCSTKREE